MVRVGRVGINDVRPIMTLISNPIYSLTPSPAPPGQFYPGPFQIPSNVLARVLIFVDL